MSINKSLFEVIVGKKEVCCLCLKDQVENLIHVEEHVTIEENNTYIGIGDLLKKIIEEDDILEVISLFGTICKPCISIIINFYKFIQSIKENHQELVKTIQKLSNLLKFVSNKSKTVFIDVNNNKQYNVNKILTSKNVVEKFTMLQRLNANKIKKYEENSKNVYNCNICSNLLTSEDDLKHHILINHSEKFNCIKCNNFFKTFDELNTHKIIHKSKFICTVCGKVLFKKKALENHEERHKITLVCSSCGRVYKNKDSFRIHILNNICNSKSRAQPNNGKYICDYCNKKYTQKITLRTHIQYEHLNYKAHECQHCNKKFWAQSRLKTHILKHTKEKKFKCLTCGGRFVTKDTLLYHTRMHTGEKPYDCEVCGDKFISASRRLIHHKKEHLNEIFKCDVCSLEYSSKYRLQKHVRLKHDVNKM